MHGLLVLCPAARGRSRDGTAAPSAAERAGDDLVDVLRDRITSYNVCYTKLLREPQVDTLVHDRANFLVEDCDRQPERGNVVAHEAAGNLLGLEVV